MAEAQTVSGTFVDEQVRLRTLLGLNADRAYVQSANQPGSTLAAANSFEMSSLYHIPVSATEERELVRREAVTNTLPGLIPKLAQLAPSTFLAVWFDQQGGGIVHISATKASSMPQSVVLNALPAGTDFTVDTVPYSNRDLQAVVERLGTDWPSLRGEGIAMENFSIDVKTGRIDVGLADSSIAGAEDRLLALYGPSLLIQRGASPIAPLNRRHATIGRLYGGLEISSNLGDCTESTSAYGTYGYFMITAGHCGDHTQIFRNVSGPLIGQGYNNGYFQTYGGATHCDCQAVGPIAASDATNQVITQNSFAAYSRTPYYTEFGVGTRVCHDGYRYADLHQSDDISCGLITNGSTTETLGNGAGLFDGFEVAAAAYHGDSGAPFGNGPTFMGVLSGINLQDYNIYGSKSYYIQEVTGAAPIFVEPY